jgi:Kef-type K+ transport system membrane component KefB
MVPVFKDYKRKLFPYGSQDTLASITALGYVFFLFETGIKMDFHTIMKTGKKAWVITFCGLVTPIITGFVTRNVRAMNAFNNSPLEANIVMIGHNTTSFAVIVALLNDLKLLNSELGRLALSVSLIGDLLSNIVVTLSSTLVTLNSHISFGTRLGSLIGIAIFVLFIYRPAMLWIVQHTPEGKEVKDIYVNIVIGILFGLCWFSGYLERGPVFLPFIFGLATPEGPPLGSTLIKRIHLLGIKLFLPIFMATTTMKVEYGFWNTSSASTFDVFLYVLFIGYFAKMVACFICSLSFNMPPKDAISLSLLLNCKGVVEVTMYATALDRNVSTKIPLHHHTTGFAIFTVGRCNRFGSSDL